jgi:hypothetical protein
VGNHNFGIVFVWIVWWALLMLVAVPLAGRSWCAVCPIPMPGEWLQNGALLKPRGKGFGLKRKWPRRFRNIWLQNISFTLLALFSAVVLTQPSVTGGVLLIFLIVALVTSLIFERRAFCRYLCPVGGFIGLYSQAAPVEVRVKDPAICMAHKEKSCYTGSMDGYGCPWLIYPGTLTKNINCGLCMECLRTCTQDNVAFNLRSFGADLKQPSGHKLDEAFKAFIMLGAALMYSVVMLGPWGALKSTEPLKKSFAAFATALIPLGLMAWIAFSLSFVFASLSYVWPVLSDPLGGGWNLFGTAHVAWQPYLMSLVPFLQAGVLIGGLLWANVTARRIAAKKHAGRGSLWQALPVMGFCFIITVGLMGLLIG